MRFDIHAGAHADEWAADVHLHGLPGKDASRTESSSGQLRSHHSELSERAGAGRRRRGARRACLGSGGLRHKLHFSLWCDSYRILCGRRCVEGYRESDALRANPDPDFDGSQRALWRRDFLYVDRDEAPECAVLRKVLNVIVVHLWEIESKGSGVLSLVFGLVGAGYALYSARKPKFQAVFQPLGAPNA